MQNKLISNLALILFITLLTACSSEQKIDNVSTEKTDHSDNNVIEDVHTEENYAPQKPTDTENNLEIDIEINDDEAITVLVNKQQGLDENYVPDDLVTVDVPTILENPEVNQLRKVAAEALKEMFDAAAESNIYLYARSGYRSYQTQVQLFNSYAENHGEEAANIYSAKPGESEHQTGLTMDVTSESVNYQLTEQFGETKEGKWVQNHAHEYGFIIRYPKGMETVTGYIYEPWHLRYLGKNVATKVYESGLTYEEYLAEIGLLDEVSSND